MFAVEAINGNAQFGVGVTFPFDHVVLGMPLDTMLGAKKGRKLKEFAVVFLEQIEGIMQIRENRCRVEDCAKALALEVCRENLFEARESECDHNRFGIQISEFGVRS